MIVLVADVCAQFARSEVTQADIQARQRLYYAPLVEEQQCTDHGEGVENERPNCHESEDPRLMSERDGPGRQPFLQRRTAFSDGPDNARFDGVVFRSVNNLNSAREIVALDGGECLIFDLNQAVGVLLGPGEEFEFLRGEAKLL